MSDSVSDRLQLEWIVLKSEDQGTPTGSNFEGAVVPGGIQLTGNRRSGPLLPTAATAGRPGRKPRAKAIQVELERMTAGDARDKLQEKNIVGAMLSMPVMLIRSVASMPFEGPTDKVAWGVKAVGAQNSQWDGAGIVVAVLDTGIEKTHEAFAKVSIETRNFCPGESDEDMDGHGTHCAGTIFGGEVDHMRIGIAPKISKALIGKVIGKEGGSSAAIIKAIQWAQSMDADVVSMSLGIDFPGFVRRLIRENGLDEREATSIALAGYTMNLRMFDKLSRGVVGEPGLMAGSVVTAAAGNESRMPDFSIIVAPPASAEAFVSVAALDHESKLASFSNVGAKLAAPGVDIVSAKRGGGLATMSGTSMATPHVAGVAALWASKILKEQGELAVDAPTVIGLMRNKAKSLEPFISRRDVEWGMVTAP